MSWFTLIDFAIVWRIRKRNLENIASIIVTLSIAYTTHTHTLQMLEKKAYSQYRYCTIYWVRVSSIFQKLTLFILAFLCTVVIVVVVVFSVFPPYFSVFLFAHRYYTLMAKNESKKSSHQLIILLHIVLSILRICWKNFH